MYISINDIVIRWTASRHQHDKQSNLPRRLASRCLCCDPAPYPCGLKRKMTPVPSAAAATIVVVEEATTIQSLQKQKPLGLYALLLGTCLVLHTVAWILLLWYNGEDGNSRDGSSFIAWLSYYILEWTPWAVSVGWTLFLAGLLLFMGFAKVSGKME